MHKVNECGILASSETLRDTKQRGHSVHTSLRRQLDSNQAHWQAVIEDQIDISLTGNMSLAGYMKVVKAMERLAILSLRLDKTNRRLLDYRTIAYTAWKLIMSKRFDEALYNRFGGIEFARETLDMLESHEPLPHSIRQLKEKVSRLL